MFLGPDLDDGTQPGPHGVQVRLSPHLEEGLSREGLAPGEGGDRNLL